MKPQENNSSGSTSNAPAPFNPERKAEILVRPAGTSPEIRAALEKRRARYQMVLAISILSALSSLMIFGVLVTNHARGGRVAYLLKDGELAALRKELRSRPKDEGLKIKIRRRDYELRNNLYNRLAFDNWGTWFLAGTVVLTLASAHGATSMKRNLPNPLEWGVRTAAREIKQKQDSRLAITSLAAAMACFLLVVGFSSARLDFLDPEVRAVAQEPGQDRKAEGVESQEHAKLDKESSARAPREFAPALTNATGDPSGQWARFRGPYGDGRYNGDSVPIEWDAQLGKNFRWKAEIPLDGLSSPIVWNDRVFLTGASRKEQAVYCFSTADGKLLWTGLVPEIKGRAAEEPELFDEAGRAACSSATNGVLVFSLFATGDLVAFDFQGQLIWARHMGLAKDPYGHASSLLIWKDALIVQYDHNAETSSAPSALYALKVDSGETIWKTERDYGATWGSPIIAKVGKEAKVEQLVTVTAPYVVGNDPRTGTELWKLELLDGDVAPSPVCVNGRIYVTMADACTAALEVAVSGEEAAQAKVVWKSEDLEAPETSSPVTNGELFWMVSVGGTLVCVDAADGSQIWAKKVDLGGYSSPTIAGEHLFVTGEGGKTLILKAARAYVEVGRGRVGEKVSASLAFHEGLIFIRGQKHLFCMGRQR